MPDDKNDLLNFAVRSTLQDDVGLRTSWYTHVLHTLEKLDSHMDKLSNEMYRQRDEFRKELYELREKIRTESVDSRSLALMEKHLDDLLNKLDNRVTQLEQIDDTQLKSDIEVIRVEISKHKQEWTDQIVISYKTLKDEMVTLLDPFKNKITKLEVKVALIGIISGVLGSGITAFVLDLLKDLLSSGGKP